MKESFWQKTEKWHFLIRLILVLTLFLLTFYFLGDVVVFKPRSGKMIFLPEIHKVHINQIKRRRGIFSKDVRERKANLLLGQSYIKQKKYNLAIEAYEKARAEGAEGRDEETAAQALYELGNCYAQLGKYKDAISYYMLVSLLYGDKYRELKIKSTYETGCCFEKLNQWDKAKEAYQRLVDRYGDADYAKIAAYRLELLKRKEKEGFFKEIKNFWGSFLKK